MNEHLNIDVHGTVIGHIAKARPSKIKKYELSFSEVSRFMMPRGSRVLHVDFQHGGGSEIAGCIWVIYDLGKENDLVERAFEILADGEVFDASRKQYIGTYLVKRFVWHAFELV